MGGPNKMTDLEEYLNDPFEVQWSEKWQDYRFCDRCGKKFRFGIRYYGFGHTFRQFCSTKCKVIYFIKEMIKKVGGKRQPNKTQRV